MWAVLAVCVTAGLGVLSAAWAPLRHQVMLSVSKQPQSYVEMYFSDYAALPITVRAGTTYRVPFTLVAHGTEPRSIEVASTVEYGAQRTDLGRQVLSFGPGRRAAGTVTFTPPVRRVVYHLLISLPSGQDIQWRVLAP